MSKSNFIIDFSGSYVLLPQATPYAWQQEVIEFIRYYQSHQIIPVQTSGSTGKPKTYELTKAAMQQSSKLTADFLNLEAGMSALLCMPVSYIAGKMMVVRAIEIGMKLICIEPRVQLRLDEIKEIDFVALTPMQAEKSLDSLLHRVSIHKLILGGAKVSKHLEDKLKNINSHIYETYGMTETITHIAMRKLNEQSYFHTLPKIEIRQNEHGCLQIQTPYFKEEIITNDVVEIFDSNQFKVMGRVDNIINSGGLKINPEDLEEKLKAYIQYPFIVHGIADQLLGQKVVLIIESEHEFKIQYPKNIIPKNKQPKAIYFVQKLPRTQSGKIQRNKIDIAQATKIQ